MFIIWGEKLVSRNVGYVADYCWICRQPQPFLLKRIGSAGHLYYITFSSGSLVGFERVCQKCKSFFSANPTDYLVPSKKVNELQALITLTYPNLVEAMKAQIDLEEKIQRDVASFSVEERKALVLDRMMSFAGKVETRFAAIHLDKEIGLAIIVTILLMTFSPELVDRLFPNNEWETAMFLGVVGFIVIIWQFVISGRRFMNRKILPQLAQSLHLISPLDDELKQATADLTKRGLKMGKNST